MAELHDSITAEEFAAWRHYHRVEPFGPAGDDDRWRWMVWQLLSAWSLKPIPHAEVTLPWDTPPDHVVEIPARQALQILASRK